MAERRLEAASREEALQMATKYMEAFRISTHMDDRLILDIRNEPVWILALRTIVSFVLPAGAYRRELVDSTLSNWTSQFLKIVIVFPTTKGLNTTPLT